MLTHRTGSIPVLGTSLFFYIAGWSSLVARRAHNPKVVGSNPAPATIRIIERLFFFLLYKLVNNYIYGVYNLILEIIYDKIKQ